MKYLLREDMAEMIRNKYKNSYVCDKLHLTKTYVSLIFNRKKPIAQVMAFAITKAIDNEANIDDFFEEV